MERPTRLQARSYAQAERQGLRLATGFGPLHAPSDVGEMRILGDSEESPNAVRAITV